LILSPCNTHGRHVLDINEQFDYCRCLECGNVFISNVVVNERFLEKYYSCDYYNDDGNTVLEKFAKLYSSFAVRTRNNIIRKYSRSGHNKLSVLDIGCGSGSFLEHLDAEQYEKYGVEINQQGIQLCQSKGIKVYDRDVRSVDFAGKTFDIVTLWHVLEHVNNPVSFTERIKAIKKTDGIIFVSIPNTDSLGFKLGKKWWFHLDAPRHLFLPNVVSMTKLINSAGLQIVDVFCPKFEFPLDLFWSVRKSPVLLAVYPLYPLFKLVSRETLVFILK
jgi:2-polyprenyl-3-methyl-5-hydroxy-6-metoxy-1,4-benzoquinol methylase